MSKNNKTCGTCRYHDSNGVCGHRKSDEYMDITANAYGCRQYKEKPLYGQNADSQGQKKIRGYCKKAMTAVENMMAYVRKATGYE